jgi:hypothetical protein
LSILPFTISGVYSSLGELEGLARLEEGGLVLEFSVTDAFVGVLKSQPKEVLVAFADLAEATFKRGLFSGKLIIRTRRMSAISDIPGSSQGELRLQCRRKHWGAATELAAQLNLRIAPGEPRSAADASGRSSQEPTRPPIG